MLLQVNAEDEYEIMLALTKLPNFGTTLWLLGKTVEVHARRK